MPSRLPRSGDYTRRLWTDQELFNALAEEDLMREALEDEAFRRRLRRRLRELNREEEAGGFVAGLAGCSGVPPWLPRPGWPAVAIAVGTHLLLEGPWREAEWISAPPCSPARRKGFPG